MKAQNFVYYYGRNKKCLFFVYEMPLDKYNKDD